VRDKTVDGRAGSGLDGCGILVGIVLAHFRPYLVTRYFRMLAADS
jgi:hypothetical protein